MSADYFASVGIPLREGRAFASSDVEGAPPVLIVNESFVHRYFPEGRAMGQRVRLDFDEQPFREIVEPDEPKAPATLLAEASAESPLGQLSLPRARATMGRVIEWHEHKSRNVKMEDDHEFSLRAARPAYRAGTARRSRHGGEPHREQGRARDAPPDGAYWAALLGRPRQRPSSAPPLQPSPFREEDI